VGKTTVGVKATGLLGWPRPTPAAIGRSRARVQTARGDQL